MAIGEGTDELGRSCGYAGCGGGWGLVFCGLTVLIAMRWLLLGLLVSLVALLVVAGAAVRHVLRQRQLRPEEAQDAGLPKGVLEALPELGSGRDEANQDRVTVKSSQVDTGGRES